MFKAGQYRTFEISTAGVPPRDRIALWREGYGRNLLRLEIEPLSDAAFRSKASIKVLPGLLIARATHTPMRIGRSRQLISDCNDDLILQISTEPGSAEQLGREAAAPAGSAVLLSSAAVGRFTYPAPGTALSLRIPRALLERRVRDIQDALVRPIFPESASLRLLKSYLRVLDDHPDFDPQISAAVAAHVHDLVVLALGATRDAAEAAVAGGLRAARLRAIHNDVLARLDRADLRVPDVARRQGVTPRYVQMLFEAEGTTFTQFLLAQRLGRAHRRLSDPADAGSIISIAFDTGFSDVSHFNRAFRRRYGASPRDIRFEAHQAVGDTAQVSRGSA